LFYENIQEKRLMPETIRHRRYDRLIPCGLAMLLILLTGMGAPVCAADAPQPFDTLQKRLIDDGFDSDRIKEIFASPESPLKREGSAPISCTTNPS
jgi:hypothetical protein